MAKTAATSALVQPILLSTQIVRNVGSSGLIRVFAMALSFYFIEGAAVAL